MSTTFLSQGVLTLSEVYQSFQNAMNRNDFDAALSICEQALAEETDLVKAARLSHMAGRAGWSLQRVDIAGQHFGAGVAHLQEQDAPELLFVLLTDYGLVLYDGGDHDGAMKQYLRAREIDIGDPARIRALDRRIASMLLDECSFEEADALLGHSVHGEADIAERFAWTNYRLLLAERTGDIQSAQNHATTIRELWAEHGTQDDIRAMSGAMVTALRVDAVLRGEPFVADDIAEMSKMDDAGLSLNTYARLALLKARLQHEKGDTDASLTLLDTTFAKLTERYGQLPLDIIVERKAILDEAERGAQFLDEFDQMAEGQILDQTFSVEDLTSEQAPLVLMLLTTEGLERRCPDLFQRAQRCLMGLLFDKLQVEEHWQAAALFAKQLAPPQSRIFFAKMACQTILDTAASAISFPTSRQTYVKARLSPFETAIALLYSAGRLHEAREIAKLASIARSRIELAAGSGDDTRLSCSETEADVRQQAQKSTESTVKGLINGDIWPRKKQARPAAPSLNASKPTLRILRGEKGYLIDASTSSEAVSSPVTASEGELTFWTSALLNAAEQNLTDPQAAHALRSALIPSFLEDEDEIAIIAEGVAAAIPFALLFPSPPRISYLKGY